MQLFDRAVAGLNHQIRAIDSCPSLQTSESFAGRARSLETLIDTLCLSEPSGVDFVLPTRAVLSRAYLQSKINFFKAVIYTLSNSQERFHNLLLRVQELLDESIFAKLAEELLIGCVTNIANPIELKKRAAGLIFPIWCLRGSLPMESFTRLLLSAWRARCRVQETFGTLVGVQEVFSLMRADCETPFVDFFTREFVTTSESEAFREFLFGLSFEDLQKLRSYMEENHIYVIGPNDVWRILGRPPPPKPDPRWSAEAMYLSYGRRRIRADYRSLSKSPGPHKTAEGYLMEYYLIGAGREAAGAKAAVS